MDQRCFFHIINPNSKNKDEVAEYLKNNPGHRYVWVNRDSHPTHLETIIEWVLIEGYEKLAVWGGDGTFSRVIQALYERDALSKIQLALMAVGTGNDFSRKLNLRDWRRMMQSISEGKEYFQKYDVGLIEADSRRRIFINNAGFGRTPQHIQTKRNNPLKDIFSFNEKKLEVTWLFKNTQQTRDFLAYMVIVFNSPFFNKGMFLQKDIEPNDGILNTVIVPPQSKIRMAGKLLKSLLHQSMWDNSMVRLDAESLVIEADQDLYIQADGEKVFKSPARKLTFSILKEKLSLFVIPAKAGIQSLNLF